MKHAIVRVEASGTGRSGIEHFRNGLRADKPNDEKRMRLSGSAWLIDLESDTDFLVEILALAELHKYPYDVWYFDQTPTRFSKKATG